MVTIHPVAPSPFIWSICVRGSNAFEWTPTALTCARTCDNAYRDTRTHVETPKADHAITIYAKQTKLRWIEEHHPIQPFLRWAWHEFVYWTLSVEPNTVLQLFAQTNCLTVGVIRCEECNWTADWWPRLNRLWLVPVRVIRILEMVTWW